MVVAMRQPGHEHPQMFTKFCQIFLIIVSLWISEVGSGNL